MLRVLLVHAGFEIGGTETQILNLLTHADPDEVRFEVAWTARSPGSGYETFRATGAPIHRVRDSKLVLPLIPRLRRLIAARGYDAVCGFCAQNIGRAMMVARSCGVRSRLACFRSTDPHMEGIRPRALYLRLDRWLSLRHATRLLGNSQAVLDGYFPDRPTSSDRYRVWPNGLAMARFEAPVDREAVRHSLGLDPGDLVVGYLGRFIKSKNLPTVVRVAKRLSADRPNLRLLLVGYGPELDAVQAAVKEAGLAGRAVLPGARTDAPAMLASMDLFVFPSLYEGFPNALLEAMAAGVPFVASDIGPNIEAVPEDARSFLAPPTDVNRLTDLAERLLRDRDLSMGLAAACRRHVAENYSIEMNLRRLLGFIREDCGKP